MKEIPLTKGLVALVDDEDYEFLSQYKWYPLKSQNTHYAWSKKHGRMHHKIVSLEPGKQIDHRNGNGLDNRRANLRLCTRSQNQWNQLPRQGTSSRFKGVCWINRDNRWRAQIKLKDKRVYLGNYTSEIDAATAYNDAATRHYGDFACLNPL